MNCDAIVTLEIKLESMVDPEDFETMDDAVSMCREIIEEEGINGLAARDYLGIGGPYKIKDIKLRERCQN